MKRYIVGMLGGWAVWAILFAVGYSYLPGDGLLARSAGRIGFMSALASMPIGFGGWVYVWGDGPGQPPGWATTMWFSVAFGLILYGALGATAGAIHERLRRQVKV